jgi:DNA-binding GntR family transcriptional regulator
MAREGYLWLTVNNLSFTINYTVGLPYNSVTGEEATMETGIVRTLREQIVSRLREDILSGRVERGESLREADLAKRFGVSRGPVRDALLQLTKEGLLVSRPYCGVKVAEGPSEAVRGLVIRLRKEIELFALQRAFDQATPEDLRAWEAILERLRKACEENDLAGVVEHDMAFHRWIVDRPGEPDLLAMWLPIVTRMRLVYSRHDDLADVYPEHRKVLDAFRRGDREAALAALEENIV